MRRLLNQTLVELFNDILLFFDLRQSTAFKDLLASVRMIDLFFKKKVALT